MHKAFDPNKVMITRHRQSTTQGEVTLEYDGRSLGRFGDNIQLREHSGPALPTVEADELVWEGLAWIGHDNAFWIEVARKFCMGRGFSAPFTVEEARHRASNHQLWSGAFYEAARHSRDEPGALGSFDQESQWAAYHASMARTYLFAAL